MDDDSLQVPKIFANKVILQLIQHTVSETAKVEPRDYLALRVVFKKCGGSWEKLGQGDRFQIELLKQIVISWSGLPERKQKAPLV